ncbi:3-oxoacyl-[acyl-carrier-protein] reductase [bacterium]|nr:3-oxoacyl-[acyl-carrier-protein] reductase [bacterium]
MAKGVDLEKRTILITGAGRGIGYAIATKLAEQNYNLVLVDINADDLENAVKTLPGDGKFIPFTCDVSDYSQVETVVAKAIEEMGPIYGLVNNAGITRDGLLLRMKPEDWDLVLRVNLTGTFNFTKLVSANMIRQKIGRIVNIASVIGLTGNAGQANYAASKAGVIALTKSVAKELGGRAVTCNAIAPGFIATDMTDKLPEQVRESMLKSIPLKKFGQSEDIAAVVSFLMSEDAAYITGQTLTVDGGMVT